jgi:hypothetical protein
MFALRRVPRKSTGLQVLQLSSFPQVSPVSPVSPVRQVSPVSPVPPAPIQRSIRSVGVQRNLKRISMKLAFPTGGCGSCSRK